MKSRTWLALTTVTMMLSASLVMAQGSTPTTAGTAHKTTTAAKIATSAAPVKAAVSSAPAKVATAAAPAKTAMSAAPAKAAASTAQAKAAAASSLVDLNTASKADLMKLPGVGEAISAKIIAGRPWANKSQLLAKGLVSKPAYAKLSSLVIAKQAGAAK